MQWAGFPGEAGNDRGTCPGDGSRGTLAEESDREKTEGERYMTLSMIKMNRKTKQHNITCRKQLFFEEKLASSGGNQRPSAF